MLGLMGGALGVGVAYGGLRLLVAIGPANLPRLNEISLDALVAGVHAGAVACCRGCCSGSIPALKYARARHRARCAAAGATASASRERHRARNVLVVAQVALALVLLVSAALMIRTFQHLRTVEPGFTERRISRRCASAIPESMVPDPEMVMRMQNDIVDKLAAIPGVKSVGFAAAVPMEGSSRTGTMIFVEGKSETRDDIRRCGCSSTFRRVSFTPMGRALIAGRDFTWTDLYGCRPVAMVSENLAREMWGSPAAAIGKRIREFPAAVARGDRRGAGRARRTASIETAPAIVYWPADAWTIFRCLKAFDVARASTFVDPQRARGHGGAC